MTKMLCCGHCGETYSLPAFGTDGAKYSPRRSSCMMCAGFFLDDNQHVVLIGPAIGLGLFITDLAEACIGEAPKESGYWPVRVWRIPDGDRIIVISSSTGKIKVPCKYNDFKITPSVAAIEEEGKQMVRVRVVVQVVKDGSTKATEVNLLPEVKTAEEFKAPFLPPVR